MQPKSSACSSAILPHVDGRLRKAWQHVHSLKTQIVCLGAGAPTHSTVSGFPLRTQDNADNWLPLVPLVTSKSSGHMAGGKRFGFVLQPSFGGRRRRRKEVPPDEPYTKENPCKEKKMGQGPERLGFWHREDPFNRKHRRKARGPREIPFKPTSLDS